MQELALKTHLEARQRDDLRRDLIASFRFDEGPFLVGDAIFYWHVDPNKIKRGLKTGEWLKGKVVSVDGPMCGIDVGSQILMANATKLKDLTFSSLTDSESEAIVCTVDE